MSSSDRGADGRDESTAGEQKPQLRYIAPMPVPRRGPAPSPDEDPTEEHAVTQDSAPPESYVRPATPTPAEAQAPAAPVVAETTRSASKGGWLAPLAVMVLSIGALAAVFLVTQGGSDSPTPPPSLAATSSPSRSSSTSSPSTPPASSAPATTASPSSSNPPSPSPSTSSRSTPTQPAQLPAGVKVCRPRVGAGGTTSCGFANNVASAVGANARKSGAFAVKAWSPTTKKDYRLRCTAAPVTVCTGGRAAVIYVAR